jgi:hypothetical protein
LDKRDPHHHFSAQVLVGAQRLKTYLYAKRLSPSAVARRQAQLRLSAHKKQCPISPQAWLLTLWAVCITNASPDLLSFAHVMLLLRLRWQLELLFKLWKSYGLLDEWCSTNPWRILTEIYAKLLALLLQHWLTVVGLWHLPNPSLVLAAQLIRKFAFSLACLFRALPSCTMSSLHNAPHTFQLLPASPYLDSYWAGHRPRPSISFQLLINRCFSKFRNQKVIDSRSIERKF